MKNVFLLVLWVMSFTLTSLFYCAIALALIVTILTIGFKDLSMFMTVLNHPYTLNGAIFVVAVSAIWATISFTLLKLSA